MREWKILSTTIEYLKGKRDSTREWKILSTTIEYLKVKTDSNEGMENFIYNN